jgi:prepilin-type N-terminal cleavage/methylation domain-containing protein
MVLLHRLDVRPRWRSPPGQVDDACRPDPPSARHPPDSGLEGRNGVPGRLPGSSRTEHGFTLVELLVSMVVIGILLAIAVPEFQASRERAYRSAIGADLHHATLDVEAWASDRSDGYSDLDDSDLGRRTAQVRVTVSDDPATTRTSYCIEGSHDRLPTEVWRYKSGVDVAPRRLSCEA